MPEDEARRLPLDEIVIVVDAQMPIRAKRVVYFEDPFFKNIHAAQEGDLPFPAAPDATEGAAGRAKDSETGREPPGLRGTQADETVEANVARHQSPPPRTSKRGRARTVQDAVVADEQRQMEMGFAAQAELALDDPTADDVEHISKAFSDLDRLEGEVSSSSESAGEVGERLGEVNS